MLVAANGLRWFQTAEPVESAARQNALHGGAADPGLLRDLAAGEALTAQAIHFLFDDGCDAAGAVMGPRGAIGQAGLTMLLKTKQPFAGGPLGDREGHGGRLHAGSSLQNQADHGLSTFGR